MKTLIALFNSAATAQNVVGALEAAGVARSNINMETGYSETTTTTTAPKEEHRSFFDWLFGPEIPEDDANVYAESLHRGDYAVVVNVEDADANRIEDVLNDYDPIDVDSRGEYFRQSGWTKYDSSEGAWDETKIQADRQNYEANYRTMNAGESDKLEVVQEELQVGKRDVERGGVRVHTYVTERPVEAQVTLREEHVTVNRTPVNRAATSADLDTFQEGVIEMTEMAEEAVIGKTARVVEEVSLGKESTEHTETVRDTVRRKDVEVETLEGTNTTYETTTTRR